MGPASRSANGKRRPPLGVWPRAEDAPLGLADRNVINAGLPASHEAIIVELPQLVAVAAIPLATDVMALVLEPDRDPVAMERPHVLAQGVVKLPAPLAAQEIDDFGPAVEELVAVPPHRVFGIRAG